MCSSLLTKNKKPKKIPKRWLVSLFLIVFFGGLFRFYNLNWDQGHYLHPDERLYINASSLRLPSSLNEFFSPDSPLNPHMFYYGSLPLYTYVFLYRLIQPFFGGPMTLLIFSRMISATLSTLTIIVLFILTRELISLKGAWLASVLFAFSVGSIQYAHYNTTESALTFLIVFLTYLSLRFYKIITKQRFYLAIGWVLAMASVLGAATATKVTGLSFAITPITSFLLAWIYLWKSKKRSTIFLIGYFLFSGFVLVMVASIVAFLGAPYNLIDYPSFYKEQEYMQGVILGRYKPPFTIIYEHTIPYFYQLTRILPWIFSPVTLIFSIAGFCIIWFETIKRPRNRLILILIWPTIYFAVISTWYAKFTRYMVLLLPFLSLFTAYAFEFFVRKQSLKTAVKIVSVLVVTTQVLYALGFIQGVYGQTHTRITTSEWIYENVERGSTIATEHWDDGLPLPRPGKRRNQFRYLELKVYDQDTDEKINKLTKMVSQADYLVFSSRRVFYSIQRNPKKYPFTARFYDLLFKEKLGFTLIRKEAHYPQFLGFVVNDDLADESFQSYDHPPTFVFKNQAHLKSQKLKEMVKKL